MYFSDFPQIGTEGMLPVFLLSVGLNEWQYHVINEEGDSCAKLLYCTKGRGMLISEGRSYLIEPYTAFYIPAGCPHEYYSLDDVWDTHWVVPAGEGCVKMFRDFGFDSTKVFSIGDGKYLEHVFRKMHNAISGDRSFGNFRASAYLYDFLIEFYRLCSDHNAEQSLNPIVAKAADYINSNCSEQIRMEDLCLVTGVSEQHLCRLFRSVLNCRPMEYVARCRIKKAKELLVNTNLSVDEISEKAGFCTSSYFCKLFRRYEGMTPTQLRNAK